MINRIIMYMLFSLGFLIGCCQFDRAPGYYISTNNPDLLNIIDTYKQDRKLYLGSSQPTEDIEFLFVNLPKSTIGRCVSTSNDVTKIDKRVIKLDTIYWDNVSYNCKLLLVYHELGHCDLNLDHVNDPSSIMHEKAPCLSNLQSVDSYVEELFKLVGV